MTISSSVAQGATPSITPALVRRLPTRRSAGDHTSKLLDKVIEKGDDLADIVAGSKEAYETKTSTKSKKVDQRLKSSANDDYKQQLLSKYGKK